MDHEWIDVNIMASQPTPPNVPPSRNKGLLTIGLIKPLFLEGGTLGGVG